MELIYNHPKAYTSVAGDFRFPRMRISGAMKGSVPAIWKEVVVGPVHCWMSSSMQVEKPKSAMNASRHPI